MGKIREKRQSKASLLAVATVFIGFNMDSIYQSGRGEGNRGYRSQKTVEKIRIDIADSNSELDMHICFN